MIIEIMCLFLLVNLMISCSETTPYEVSSIKFNDSLQDGNNRFIAICLNDSITHYDFLPYKIRFFPADTPIIIGGEGLLSPELGKRKQKCFEENIYLYLPRPSRFDTSSYDSVKYLLDNYVNEKNLLKIEIDLRQDQYDTTTFTSIFFLGE